MKITKIMFISFILCFAFASYANGVKTVPISKVSTEINDQPTYGQNRMAIQAYFDSGVSLELKNGDFTRSIFRLAISEEGLVQQVAVLNHALSLENENELIELINQMEWNRMSEAKQIHLILEIGEGQINVELR